MADHSVAELRLHVSATSASRTNLGDPAERFVASVLETAGDRIESKWPGRLVFLRRLPLHWKIGEDELSDAAAIARYADEIAASLEHAAPQPPGRPVADQNLVVFRNEAHWWASFLAASAAGGGEERAWAYESLRTKGVSFASLAGGGRDFTIAVLVEMAQAGTLRRVVSTVELQAIEDVCRSLELAVRDGVLETGPGKTTIPHPAHRAALRERARGLPAGLPLLALSLILYVEAALLLGDSAPAEEAAALVAFAVDELGAVRRQRQPVAPGSGEPEAVSPLPELASPVYQTQFGGLFYLLTLALEMEIAEILWKVCLPEGSFLAHCTGALLGPPAEHDPAPLLFGGVPSPEASPPEVAQEQVEEVAMALVERLAAALPRWSLARLPEVVLFLAPGATSQVLVASERDSPFALFVWPVSSARDVEKGLRAFLAAWPASAPLMSGSPPLAEVEGHVRVRAASRLTPPSELFLPRSGSTWTSALTAQIVGTLCHLFSARAGVEMPRGAAGLVERYLAVPAAIHLPPQEMEICFSLSRIEILLRRSGLDRDPGWVSWLRRNVRFVFAEDTPS